MDADSTACEEHEITLRFRLAPGERDPRSEILLRPSVSGYRTTEAGIRRSVERRGDRLVHKIEADWEKRPVAIDQANSTASTS